jgi:hypothetical protein
VNVSEAKSLLLLYRPGTADAEDPQMAGALALAKSNPELAAWFEAHRAQQEALRVKFKQITPPAGLKEQIISEHAASRRAISRKPVMRLVLAGLFLLLLLGTLAVFWFPRPVPGPENTLAIYQNQMVRLALGGYAMSLMTNDPATVHAYLAQNHAPDFRLPDRLKKAALAGCAAEEWQGAKVSLVCFRTGKPLPPGTGSDLWLFVVDRASVKDAPEATIPQLAKVNRLITATWSDGDKLYFLGLEGGEQDIKEYLDTLAPTRS